MSTKTFLDESTSSTSGIQLDGLEPVDVLGIEEHVADCDELLVDLERMACQHDALRDNTGIICREERAGGDEVKCAFIEVSFGIFD